jgi:signal transduction histidine kinase
VSLSAKMFWYTVVVLAIVLGPTVWWSIENEREALNEVFAKRGYVMAQSLAAFSVEGLISQDYPSLDKALKTIGEGTSSIVHLQIKNDARQVAVYGRPDTGHEFIAPVFLEGAGQAKRQVGEVRVILSNREDERLLASRIRDLSIDFLALLVVLTLARHLLFHRLVLKRLASLTSVTDGVIAQHIPERKGKLTTPKGDELDLLQTRYAEMLEGLELRERERSAAMQQLMAAQARLTDVANALPAALIVLNQQLEVEACNRSALKLAVMATGDFHGHSLEALFPPLSSYLKRIVEVFQTQQCIEFNRQFWLTAKGRLFVNIAVYPLSSAAEGGLVISIDDVTERTRLEEMMIQSEKLSSLGGLAAGIAHEINNPLGVMIQAAQNIERRMSEKIEANKRTALELGTDISTIRAYLQKRSILDFLADIINDGARAAKIVRNLLEYSRKTEPALEETDLSELIDRAVEMARKDYDLKKKFDFRRIEVQLDVPSGLPRVDMIRSEVEQVILNLLKNAAQAMSEKFSDEQVQEKPLIIIRARAAPGFAEITVQDNGPGLNDEAKQRAFEPFFTTKAPGIGTGLGLWVSYMIMTDKHKGQLLLESTPGQGATFILRFPL